MSRSEFNILQKAELKVSRILRKLASEHDDRLRECAQEDVAVACSDLTVSCSVEQIRCLLVKSPEYARHQASEEIIAYGSAEQSVDNLAYEILVAYAFQVLDELLEAQ